MSLRTDNSTALPKTIEKQEFDPQVRLTEELLCHTTMAKSLATKFSALTKDLPIKLSSITKLERDGSNFQHWELDFESYVAFAPDIAGYLSEEMQPSYKSYKPDFAEIVNSIIHWTIDRELALTLRDIPHPAGRVAKLRKQFSGVLFAARQATMKSVNSLAYDPKVTLLNEHVMTMQSSRDKLKRIGVHIPDDVFGLLLANSMPTLFPDISTSFKSQLLADPGRIVSTSGVGRALGAADVTYRRREILSEVMKVAVQQDSCTEHRRCNYCYIKGHVKADCRKRIAKETRTNEGQKEVSSSKKFTAREVEAEMAGVGFSPWDEPKEVTVSKMNRDLEPDDAVFDTGATHDVSNSPKHFVDLKEIAPIKLTLANGSAKSMITAVGSVRVESPFDAAKFCIRQHVYLCNDLKHNLISGVAMYEDGLNFHTGVEGLYFEVPGGRILAKQVRRKWVLKISSPTVSACIVSSYQMWHRRLGHPNDRVLRQLIKSNAFHGMPDSLGPTTPCKVCADAKSTKTSAIGSFFRTHDRVLNLIVADLCGPFQEKSIGGAQYFLQIRDIFSTFVRVTPLVNKYDATAAIKQYVAEVERLTGEKIKYWRNDGGGEFLNKELNNFFTEKGISLEKTVRYFHEQAGIIERSQQTVQSIMRCLLFGSDLPKSFWSLAATTAAYLHNRTPNSNTNGKTPQEILLDKKPSVEHLQIFGSWAFVHVPQELQKKLDHRAVKC